MAMEKEKLRFLQNASDARHKLQLAQEQQKQVRDQVRDPHV